MRITHLGQENTKITVPHGHDSRWSLQGKLLIGAGTVTLIVLTVIAATNAYTHSQNGKIESITCDRGFSYYHDAANKNSASASDQYCFAEMLKAGSLTKQSLSEARKWYQKAAAQGLVIAEEALCHRSSFIPGSGENFDELRPICCPQTCSSSRKNPPDSCLPTSCPWELPKPWEQE